jgi:hypothetical protein
LVAGWNVLVLTNDEWLPLSMHNRQFRQILEAMAWLARAMSAKWQRLRRSETAATEIVEQGLLLPCLPLATGAVVLQILRQFLASADIKLAGSENRNVFYHHRSFRDPKVRNAGFT